jgi:hypothetical protein
MDMDVGGCGGAWGLFETSYGSSIVTTSNSGCCSLSTTTTTTTTTTPQIRCGTANHFVGALRQHQHVNTKKLRKTLFA